MPNQAKDDVYISSNNPYSKASTVKPSTVKPSTVKASTISAVAHIGQYTPQLAQVTEPPVVSEISAPLGQAFPRQEATLTPQGVVSAGVSAMRRQTYPRGGPIRGAVGTERTR